ncbi:hypothetical protein MYAM1_002799 [Malassezia yamatoensis]|uniref:Uncharacterized protein n=1 Tax=Malassezia yamatoensis TaxID=253288 RepID=A0AAJ5YUK5_9BASI|nr:hypothetical protein MYAM1_002799 [Malassezia yamatoensis]
MSGPEGEQDERLWSLIVDLSAQLTTNQQVTDALKTQVDQLQGQAVHATSGFALRRFNVDLSDEKFSQEVERLNAHLTQENTMLSHEAKQLGTLLRECESTLETVMGKFRSFSHAVQQYGLDLSAYYQSRLENQTEQLDSLKRQDHQNRDEAIARLGGLVRDVLKLVDGEDDEDDQYMGSAALTTATEIEQLRAENQMLRSLLSAQLPPEADLQGDQLGAAQPLENTPGTFATSGAIPASSLSGVPDTELDAYIIPSEISSEIRATGIDILANAKRGAPTSNDLEQPLEIPVETATPAASAVSEEAPSPPVLSSSHKPSSQPTPSETQDQESLSPNEESETIASTSISVVPLL